MNKAAGGVQVRGRMEAPAHPAVRGERNQGGTWLYGSCQLHPGAGRGGEGGMLILDGSCNRTLGGVFFYLVGTQVSDDEAMQMNRAWRWQQWKQRQPAKAKAPAAPVPPPLPPFVWDEAAPIIAELTSHVGEASTVKVTVIGRPNQVVERQGVVVVALRSTKAPTLPKGLPPLPTTPTNYMVFIQQKQWNKVRDAMQQPDDALSVEG